MKNIGYAKNYKYAHSYEGNFIDLEFLPEQIIGTKIYEPGKNPREEEMRKNLINIWKKKYGY
jgi:putative ATPase